MGQIFGAVGKYNNIKNQTPTFIIFTQFHRLQMLFQQLRMHNDAIKICSFVLLDVRYFAHVMCFYLLVLSIAFFALKCAVKFSRSIRIRLQLYNLTI